MKQSFKNIVQTFPQRYSCLFLLVLFFCLTITTPTSSLNLFVEKNVEKEVEENKKEKEGIEEESESEVGITAKSKKNKKILDKDLETTLPQIPVSNILFSPVLYQITLSRTPQTQYTRFSPVPLYIAYHKLVFYEI